MKCTCTCTSYVGVKFIYWYGQHNPQCNFYWISYAHAELPLKTCLGSFSTRSSEKLCKLSNPPDFSVPNFERCPEPRQVVPWVRLTLYWVCLLTAAVTPALVWGYSPVTRWSSDSQSPEYEESPSQTHSLSTSPLLPVNVTVKNNHSWFARNLLILHVKIGVIVLYIENSRPCLYATQSNSDSLSITVRSTACRLVDNGW